MHNSAKIALVTGGSRGLGTRDRRSAGTARRNVVLTYKTRSCRGERGGYTG
ncbi:Uncharacterised protein [Klebsiella pneumoniae]|uniref:Uncharacterized protein n=1 Tax=Klebsiella pneumoniae TaxID=573 RepID=A0A377XSC6_KLEPN|nr:Uncharacterised protein [Klebsiella pneumoniae]